NAGRLVEAHEVGSGDQRIEALADEVVAPGAHDVLADLGASAAVDATAVVAQDEAVRLVPAVAVVDADVRVVLDRTLVDRHVQRRLVLDRRLAQVAVGDRLRRALQAAGRLGHRLLAGVAELVLVEVLLARRGVELAHDRLGLLHVVGEGHDGQEARLRLRHDAAHLRVVEIVAAQPVVHRVAGAPPLADRLDYCRRPGANVAGGEDLGQVGPEDVLLGDQPPAPAHLELGADLLRLGLDPGQVRSLTDGGQHDVAVDDELGARHRLWTAATLLIGGTQLHALELDAGDLVVLIGHDARRGGLEDDARPLLDRLVGFFLGRHVLEVAAVDDRPLGGSLAHGRPRTVDGSEATADDHDAGAFQGGHRQAARRVVEVLQGIDHAVRVLPGDPELIALVA